MNFKRIIIKRLSSIFASLYWAYLKPAIDLYNYNLKLTKFKHLGDNIVIKGAFEFYHEENISINNHVRIGDNMFINGVGGVEIGKGTIISRNVCIHSGNHNYKSKEFLPYDTNYNKRKTVIGSGVWIGQNVNILPGIIVGDGAIIGMGVTVSKNIGKGEIVVGSSIRVIGSREKESLDLLLSKGDYISKYRKNI